jgi:hypothetical protein
MSSERSLTLTLTLTLKVHQHALTCVRVVGRDLLLGDERGVASRWTSSRSEAAGDDT